MGAVKITSADRWFSLCVREAVDHCCERCGGKPQKGGLHASHYHGRGKFSTRFSRLNVFALCHGCHRYFTSHPEEHRKWVKQQLGEQGMEVLAEMVNDLSRGRQLKRELKDVARHYASQLGDLQERRGRGEEGPLQFVDYL